MKRALIGIVLAGALAFVACDEAPPTGTGVVTVTETQAPAIQVEPSDTNLEAARIAWDVALSPSEQADLCAYYNTPPVGITPPLVRAFDSEAHLGYAESERVLSTVLAEEC